MGSATGAYTGGPPNVSEHTIDRPTTACLTCPPPRTFGAWRLAHTGYKTCDDCLDRLRDTITDISRRWLLLDTRPGATGDHGRGAPGFSSRSPASDHIIAMRDRRSSPSAHTWLGADGRIHHEPEHPPLSVWGVLETLAWDIAETRGIDGPTGLDVHGLCTWIDRHLDWLTRQEVVTEHAKALRELQAQLKPVTGEPGRKPIGSCPNLVDSDDGPRECGTRLLAPLRGDEIRCTTCDRAWPREEWLRLGDLLDTA